MSTMQGLQKYTGMQTKELVKQAGEYLDSLKKIEKMVMRASNKQGTILNEKVAELIIHTIILVNDTALAIDQWGAEHDLDLQTEEKYAAKKYLAKLLVDYAKTL